MAEVIQLNQQHGVDENNQQVLNAPKSKLDSFLENDISQQQLQEPQSIPITAKRIEIIDIIYDYKFSRFKDGLLEMDATIFDERKKSIEKLVYKYNSSKSYISTCNSILGITDNVLCMVGFQVQGASQVIM